MRQIFKDEIVAAMWAGPVIIQDTDNSRMLELRKRPCLTAKDFLFELIIMLIIE